MTEDDKPFDPLSKAFNVESAHNLPADPIESSIVNGERDAELRRFRESVDADFAYARDNIVGTIEQAQDALHKALELAIASQSARAFEVVAQLIKVNVDSNQSLMDLSKKSKELKREEGSTTVVGDIVNNNLYVTPAELQKMIRNHGLHEDGDGSMAIDYKEEE